MCGECARRPEVRGVNDGVRRQQCAVVGPAAHDGHHVAAEHREELLRHVVVTQTVLERQVELVLNVEQGEAGTRVRAIARVRAARAVHVHVHVLHQLAHVVLAQTRRVAVTVEHRHQVALAGRVVPAWCGRRRGGGGAGQALAVPPVDVRRPLVGHRQVEAAARVPQRGYVLLGVVQRGLHQGEHPPLAGEAAQGEGERVSHVEQHHLDVSETRPVAREGALRRQVRTLSAHATREVPVLAEQFVPVEERDAAGLPASGDV